MSERNWQLSVTWLCVALVVLLPCGYVASLGPLYGIVVRMDADTPAWIVAALGYYVVPAGFVYDHSPQIAQDALQRYVRWFDK
jgi:hypothetical protein